MSWRNGSDARPQPVGDRRYDNEVDRVGHQAPGPDLAAGFHQGRFQEIETGLAILIAKENLLPVCPLDDMVRQTGDDDAGKAGRGLLTIAIVLIAVTVIP